MNWLHLLGGCCCLAELCLLLSLCSGEGGGALAKKERTALMMYGNPMTSRTWMMDESSIFFVFCRSSRCFVLLRLLSKGAHFLYCW